MDIDILYKQNISLEVYDNLQITFNDANGMFTSGNGKGINFGTKIET